MMPAKLHIEPGAPPLNVEGLTSDSRQVGHDFLFAALPGSAADGRAFISDAIRRGARAILAPTGTTLPDPTNDVALITDDDPRRRLALMAAEFYGEQPDNVAAVTGTNGKTSVAYFTRHLWARSGRKSASLGTLGLMADGLPEEPGLTTPEPVRLHAQLATLSDAGISHLALEASSHGLAQRRLDGVRISVAGFTNLSRDHLDYHATYEDYLAAKTRLFEVCLEPGGTAVLNADAEQFDGLSAITNRLGHRLVAYGAAGDDLRLIDRRPTADGCVLLTEIFGRKRQIELPLIGSYQALNALCALGLASADSTIAIDGLIDSLHTLPSVPGRLERVGRSANGGTVYVDYAHTPDALATVLRAIREHTQTSLSVVFGCGGDRDPGKRPLMGKAAATLADRAIVTDDNPRTEDPAKIRADAMVGCPEAREIGDRRKAIAAAIEELRPGDVLVIAGKGHEPYQIVGSATLDFDDRKVAGEILTESGGAT